MCAVQPRQLSSAFSSTLVLDMCSNSSHTHKHAHPLQCLLITIPLQTWAETPIRVSQHPHSGLRFFSRQSYRTQKHCTPIMFSVRVLLGSQWLERCRGNLSHRVEVRSDQVLETKSLASEAWLREEYARESRTLARSEMALGRCCRLCMKGARQQTLGFRPLESEA